MSQFTKVVNVGGVKIGGGNPIAIQSMTNTKTADVKATVEQILRLEEAGCEIIRVSVPDIKTVELISKLKEAVKVPIVADIHFDYKLAIESAYAGVDKIRINPGNIGDDEKVKQVVDVCKLKNIP